MKTGKRSSSSSAAASPTHSNRLLAWLADRDVDKRLDWVVVVMGFVLLAAWRGWDAFEAQRSLGDPSGDAIGTIGAIHAIAEQSWIDGWARFFSDSITLRAVADGVNGPVHAPLWWRLQYVGLGAFLSPDNVYDVGCLMALTFNGAAAYFLLRTVGVMRLIALLGAFALASLENFDYRVAGHNGLAWWAFPLMAFSFAWAGLRNPTFTRAVLLGLFGVLSFQGSEYYGYFSVIFCCALATAYLILGSVHRLELGRPVRLASFFAIALLVLVVGIVLSYPSRFMPLITGTDGAGGLAPRAESDFTRFGLYSFSRIFGSAWISHQGEAPVADRNADAETSFHLGVLIPALVVLLMGLAFRRWREPAWARAGTWLVAALVITLFALPPESAFSLAPVTMKFAPMLRVSVRALLFLNVGLIVALAILVDDFVSVKPRLATVGLLLVTAMVLLADARWRSPNPFARLRTWPLPRPEALRALTTLEKGNLVELPYDSAALNGYEVAYERVFDRIFHRMPILNGVTRPGYETRTLALTEYFANPEAAPEIIRLLGVRYVVLRPDSGPLYDFYGSLPSARLVGADDGFRIFSFEHGGEPAVQLREYLGTESEVPGALFGGSVQERRLADPAGKTAMISTADGDWLMHSTPVLPAGRHRCVVTLQPLAVEESTQPHAMLRVTAPNGQVLASSSLTFREGWTSHAIEFDSHTAASVRCGVFFSVRGHFVIGSAQLEAIP